MKTPKIDRQSNLHQIKNQALVILCGLAFIACGLLDAGAQNQTTSPSLAIAKSGTNIVLSWSASDYSLETTANLQPSVASTVWTPVAGSSPVTLAATGSMGFFRLAKQVPMTQMVGKQTPWAILLCKFQDDQSEPPVPDFVPRCQKLFTSAGAGTYNTLQYFQDMSHGKLDLSGSRVFGWLTLDAKVSDLLSSADPEPKGWNSPARRAKMMTLAKQAARQSGVRLDQYSGVVLIFNIAVGGPQGGVWAGGAPGRGVFCDWRYVWANGTESFGQEMGFAYGLDGSRQDGSTEDYQDKWDGMSAGRDFWASDPNYGARATGFNAWNMRGRRWLDETRVWHAPKQGFSQVIQLRPLHRRDLPGMLAAEIPPFDGPGGHARYLVEFRAKEGWDAAIPRSAILVHRFEGSINGFLGSHSYIMQGTKGQQDLVVGDEFNPDGAGQADLRLEVLGIDENQRLATVRVTYAPHASTARKTLPQAKATIAGGSSRTPSLDQPLPPPQTNAPAAPVSTIEPGPRPITNGPAVFASTTLPATSTNLVFDHFLCNSLNCLVWTNVIAHTNDQTSTVIWSTRSFPAGWPDEAPVVEWNTNGLMWGMTGLTALSPCWQGEGNHGQVPITALSRRHGYTRGHSMAPDGFGTNYIGMTVWFVARDNTMIQATVAQAVVRTHQGGTGQDYTLLLFTEDLPAAIEPLRVIAPADRTSKYPCRLCAPWPLFQTEQGGHVSANLPGLTVDTWKGGDSGSPDLLPIAGELVFCEGRSTSGPSAQMQADMDELCRMEGLDPQAYQLQWLDLSAFPSY